jgi:cellulose synthase/poly-beta-1,6-N-acetylglucosamine synthase-like glycosyltransferase
MIFIGLFTLFFFLYTIFQKGNIGYRPLYILLIITMLYLCLKYLHEWYHYFSIDAPKKPARTRQYTVDILTTYCAGEPFDMLEETLTAIQQIRYPHTTWCCDEADDPEVRALCSRLGVKHVTRTIKKNAKAGNINNALQYATGELCVVMDPDHIPCPEFLDEVVDYFDDPSIGYVQIVQAYYNQKESLVAKGAAQQTYQFYGPMMMCMHSYGTVQAIGANCTFRRAALDSIGGHAAGLSEDMHTAMRIHAKGWKSIYVPAILTRGLVPATLSSYYKQQLKWSRGTWDLLVITYPKLFFKFTWRQKLHYFLLPFHYLCGIIFFINFLIPVISLFTGYIPLRMDIFAFALAAFPMLAMAVLIRLYVQKWVAEETERGFHIVGGILQIGAWWVHSIGFIYTLLRKKVPYIPTPKNDSDPLPLALNIPNIIIAVVSIIAIYYGFANNYNPYTLFMAVLASMQVFFMLFIFSISGYTKTDSKIEGFAKKIRKNTWLIVKTNSFLRKYSVPLSFIVVSVFIFSYKKMQELPTFLPKQLPELEVFYKGIYQPVTNNGLTAVSTVFGGSVARDNNISIASFYISNGNNVRIKLPADSFQVVYKNNGIPLINWQPFGNNSNYNRTFDDKLAQEIVSGQYDSLINSFAIQLGSLDKPIFLKPSFETGNSMTHRIYPTNIQPVNFIAAWHYIHNLFDSAKAEKVIWVWSPFSANIADEYFPGNKYVDWLGVSVLDDGQQDINLKQNTFYSLYQPFHQQPVFQAGIPVMITEAGTLSQSKNAWWKIAADNIDSAFTEIKAVIIFNDQARKGLNNLNFTAGDTRNLLSLFPASNFAKEIKGSTIPPIMATAQKYTLPDTLKGMLYDKGYYWFRNRHTMTKKTLEIDIAEIKKLGVNTLERTMPGFYDDILDKILVKDKIKLIARVSTLLNTEMITDKKKAQEEIVRIVKIVKNNKNKKNIIAWHLGDDILFNLSTQTYKPGYFYYRNIYIAWLSELCNQIRLVDNERPLVIDLNWDDRGEERYEIYKKLVPQISTYMLEATAKYKDGFIKPLREDMRWGKVPVELWPLIPAVKKSGIVPAWQDIENTDYITLNGLLDLDGRKKEFYGMVANSWGNMHAEESPIPDIKILKPLKTTREKATLTYHVLLRRDSTQWRLYSDRYKDIHFEWYLVRVDQYGITMFIKKAGIGPSISLPIPQEPQYYELHVEAVLGNDVKTARSTLNTPLNN